MLSFELKEENAVKAGLHGGFLHKGNSFKDVTNDFDGVLGMRKREKEAWAKSPIPNGWFNPIILGNPGKCLFANQYPGGYFCRFGPLTVPG